MQQFGIDRWALAQLMAVVTAGQGVGQNCFSRLPFSNSAMRWLPLLIPRHDGQPPHGQEGMPGHVQQRRDGPCSDCGWGHCTVLVASPVNASSFFSFSSRTPAAPL